MLHDLAERFAHLWNAPDAEIVSELDAALARQMADGDGGSEATFRARFIELARTRQRQHGELVAGLVTIVWPGSRLDALGGNSRKFKLLAAMETESVLEQMAAPPDFFVQHDSNNFLLCFGSANRAVAELRTLMMCQALGAALTQRIPGLPGRIRVDHVVTAFDPVEPVAKGARASTGMVDLLFRARDRSVFGAPQLPSRALAA